MRATLGILAAAALLAGCASSEPLRYSRPGTTQQAFMQDRYACLQQATQYQTGAIGITYGSYSRGETVVSGSMFRSCMVARGYRVDYKGPLVAPNEALVRLAE